MKEALMRKTIQQINALFFRPKHAMAVLGLTGMMDYQVFYRGVNGSPIESDDAFAINMAMSRWCQLYLAEGWGNAMTFTLPPFDVEDQSWKDLKPPEWTPPA